MENEIWKDIPKYRGLYQVSNKGMVKSLQRIVKSKKWGFQKVTEKILKAAVDGSGYFTVALNKNNISKTKKIHQLVAMAFLNHKPCGYKLVVNHKNFNKLDNRFENLEIVTQRENSNRKHCKGTSKYTGVYLKSCGKKWVSVISVNRKRCFLGHFKNEYSAHLAYQKELNKINNQKL